MKRRILVSAVLSVLLLAALAANVHAAEVKINASDGAAHNFFGASVAISGDYAVVGALPDTGSYSGSAYIYDIPIGIIDPGAAITHTEYDIVASVPELATVVILTLIGLLALAGYVRYARRKN